MLCISISESVENFLWNQFYSHSIFQMYSWKVKKIQQKSVINLAVRVKGSFHDPRIIEPKLRTIQFFKHDDNLRIVYFTLREYFISDCQRETWFLGVDQRWLFHTVGFPNSLTVLSSNLWILDGRKYKNNSVLHAFLTWFKIPWLFPTCLLSRKAREFRIMVKACRTLVLVLFSLLYELKFNIEMSWILIQCIFPSNI